jgi:hypothetical protein
MRYLRMWIYSLLVMSFLGSGSVALAQFLTSHELFGKRICCSGSRLLHW